VIFVGSDVRNLTSDKMFEATVSSFEIKAWIALEDIISTF
jgi:hypothetical protein